MFRIFNIIKVQISFVLSHVFKKNIVWGLPYNATIETSAVCNLKCTDCHFGLGLLKREQKFIEFDLLRNIVIQNKRHLWYINFSFQGEPFLYPQLVEAISIADKHKYITSISTNAHYLDKVNCENIIKSKLSRIIISLDGMDELVYKQYRVNGNIEKVLDGIATLNSMKKELNSVFPIIELQFIVFKHNEHQIEAFKTFAKSNADKFTIKTAQIYDINNNDSKLPTSEKHRRYSVINEKKVLKKQKKSCNRLWNTIVICNNGAISVCCMDKNAEYIDVEYNNSIKDIWYSTTLNHFRTQFLTEAAQIDICKNCY